LLRKGTPHSRAEYLLQLKFPDASKSPGPSIRSGDFTEMLIADYVGIPFGLLGPRTRYDDKTIRNESKKGSDRPRFSVSESRQMVALGHTTHI